MLATLACTSVAIPVAIRAGYDRGSPALRHSSSDMAAGGEGDAVGDEVATPSPRFRVGVPKSLFTMLLSLAPRR